VDVRRFRESPRHSWTLLSRWEYRCLNRADWFHRIEM